MQTNSVLLASKQQHVYFVTSSDSGLVQLLGLIKISCNILYTSVCNMTSLLLWNYVCDPWKLSRNNGFNSTTAVGNLAHSLVVVISRKIGLLFSAMEHDMRELLRCLERDCSYCDEKWRERFVLHAIKNFFQSSWRFLKFSGMYPVWNTSMEFHGNPWKSMEIHGIPRNSHGVSVEYPWSSMECHGVPPSSMK